MFGGAVMFSGAGFAFFVYARMGDTAARMCLGMRTGGLHRVMIGSGGAGVKIIGDLRVIMFVIMSFGSGAMNILLTMFIGAGVGFVLCVRVGVATAWSLGARAAA